jgi:hypothetical protein
VRLDAGGGCVGAGPPEETADGGGERERPLLGHQQVASCFGDPEQKIGRSAKYCVEAVAARTGGVMSGGGVDGGAFVSGDEHGLGQETSGELGVEMVELVGDAVRADPGACGG